MNRLGGGGAAEGGVGNLFIRVSRRVLAAVMGAVLGIIDGSGGVLVVIVSRDVSMSDSR